MIANLGGQQKLGAVLGAAANSPRAIAAFWLFDAVGALKYSEAPARADAGPDDSQPEIEINVTSEADARQATGAADAADAAASATSEESNATLTPAAEKMRAEVLDRLENLDSLDYYELLGIKRDVDTAVIRKAYFSAAKRYHPDAIARLGLQTIRGEAGEVFARIAEANDTLSDDAKRRDYDTLLSGDGKGVDAAVLAQAETFYRKGEILLKMGNFRGALELLQSAVGLYPDECVYQSDLGWAYFKKNPPEIEPALKHLREALRLDPSDSVAKHRLGVIEEEAPPG
jgi:tetratricopeptide (TPR) repeat protein